MIVRRIVHFMILFFLLPPLPAWAGINALLSNTTANLFIYSVFILLSILNVAAFRYRTRNLRQSNKALRQKELEAGYVLRQNNTLSNRNKNIQDSLRYAERIQRAMFTQPEELSRVFDDYFVFQQPKDIVSGDFFWAKKIDNKIFLAAVDCTGHGVPGAFMSLIGIDMFRNIILGKRVLTPARILDEMNISFDSLFQQCEDISLRDGMDISLCMINTSNSMLEFAGAFNPLYIIRNNEIIEIKGDKIFLGPDMGFGRASFTNHEILLQPSDRIYMFSDGFADQFGGPEGKKFKYRRFRHQLLSMSEIPLKDQHDVLKTSINEWRGELEQVDDILVIGAAPLPA